MPRAGGDLLRQYRSEWFESRKERARESARAVLPIVFALIGPSSLVDIGCGTGSWLAVADELGTTDIIGVDASHVDPALLEFADERFIAHDLRQALTLNRTFDLALCLEVGEHLPPRSAPTLVETLIELAPVVLFSAAIPGQGGTSHTNEQWPDYWAALFSSHGYVAYDVIRPRIWRDDRVRYFYAQNSVLYIRGSETSRYSGLPVPSVDPPLPYVHPKLFGRVRDNFPPPTSVTLSPLLRFSGKLLLRPFEKSRLLGRKEA
jgi:SAM-dependent methyltransferase